jgi:hypothetical protein
MSRRFLARQMTNLFNDAIDKAVRERNVAFLTDLIRRNSLAPEIREHLAAVIEGLLTKKIKFPNRKPKQDSEEKHQVLAERVWEVKKTTGWKLRSVVDSVAKERRCSPKTVWSAWAVFGPALEAGEVLREKYDTDALVEAVMRVGPEGAKLSEEQMKALENLIQESLAIQQARRRRRK